MPAIGATPRPVALPSVATRIPGSGPGRRPSRLASQPQDAAPRKRTESGAASVSCIQYSEPNPSTSIASPARILLAYAAPMSTRTPPAAIQFAREIGRPSHTSSEPR